MTALVISITGFVFFRTGFSNLTPGDGKDFCLVLTLFIEEPKYMLGPIVPSSYRKLGNCTILLY